MSYSAVPARRARFKGFGMINDLPTYDASHNPVTDNLKAQAQNAVDASKQQAIAFAQAQLMNSPTTASVVAQYAKYAGILNSLPGFNLDDLKDPKKCVGVMRDALLAYAAQTGIPVTTEQAKKDLEKYALDLASGYLGVPLPDSLPENFTELKHVCIDFACTAVLMDTGVDPKLIAVTAECLLDGKLDDKDCVAIGTTAGAIAGAAIASSFGIPAPIGSFIGGAAGAMVGGTVAQIFGLDDPQAQVRALQKAFDDLATATVAEAQSWCTPARSAYWDSFDNFLMATELQWEKLEVEIGWKFDLRWYGQEVYNAAGQPFSHQYLPALNKFVGPVTTANRAAILKRNINYDTYDTNNTLKETSVYWCPYEYGCPYPKSPAIPNLNAGLFERVAEAFFTRGAVWIDPNIRNLTCPFPLPPVDAAFIGENRERWLRQVWGMVQAEQAATQALQMITVSVVGDLVKTSAQVKAEKAINDLLKKSQTTLNQNAINRSLELVKAKKTGAELSDLINYGLLFVGVGALGAALYRKKKS
jgi:hypothetical protein